MKRKKKYFTENGVNGRSDSWIDYPGVGVITDDQVADHVMKHVTIFDLLFRHRKIMDATLCSQCMLMGVIEEPEDKNWKY